MRFVTDERRTLPPIEMIPSAPVTEAPRTQDVKQRVSDIIWECVEAFELRDSTDGRSFSECCDALASEIDAVYREATHRFSDSATVERTGAPGYESFGGATHPTAAWCVKEFYRVNPGATETLPRIPSLYLLDFALSVMRRTVSGGAEPSEDTQRLDWLAQQAGAAMASEGGKTIVRVAKVSFKDSTDCFIVTNGDWTPNASGETLREAIDAARRSSHPAVGNSQ